ncbi:MAG TPA: VWA domain-containing protein [Solimonas sp.]|nr:VWA domain-containing protein [Solimonas sp.]
MQLKSFTLCLATAALALACSTPQPTPSEPPPPPAAEPEISADAAAAVAVDDGLLAKEETRLQRADGASRQYAEADRRKQGAANYAMPAAVGGMMQAPPMCCAPPLPQDRETYAHVEANPIQQVAQQPVSTFSIDVDTGSYSNVRRMLRQGRLPPQDAVRVEEMINYFDYAYAGPRDRGVPFSLTTEIAPTPWNTKTHLLQVGIQGWKPQERKPSNLVFLVDVSGSMSDPDKLPLVVSSLKLLARHLTRDDRISLVVYAGNTGVVLEPTPGDRTAVIEAALDRLGAGGSTNGGEGIKLAYAMARQGYLKDGNNRVLLATDGDFNVGMVSFEQLVSMVEEKRKSGIALTTLGFGGGNYNDQLMERLADAGNGNHAYIDSLAEAQKVLVEQRDATLTTIARDVKIQVEFNPAVVSEYRLIGYDNRMLKREDFNNDQIDAGEIGAGHTVTALYEIALVGEGGERVDPLRYGDAQGCASAAGAGCAGAAQAKAERAARDGELAFLRLRYKRPEDGMAAASRLIERPIQQREVRSSIAQTSPAFHLAASVAAFGQLLHGGAWTGKFTYTDAAELARSARGEDRQGYAGEYLQLLALAQGMNGRELSGTTGE